jgi:hypothetical protein
MVQMAEADLQVMFRASGAFELCFVLVQVKEA